MRAYQTYLLCENELLYQTAEGLYKVSDEIKSAVLFRRLNLMDEFPFKGNSTPFCRNVMIYFRSDTRARLLKKIYDVLEDGGYLFIGKSESILKNETGFKYVLPSVYRKD